MTGGAAVGTGGAAEGAAGGTVGVGAGEGAVGTGTTPVPSGLEANPRVFVACARAQFATRKTMVVASPVGTGDCTRRLVNRRPVRSRTSIRKGA